MKILVLNCGSSSVKYQLFDLNDEVETVLASGLVEEVGLGSPSLTHRRPGHDKLQRARLEVKNHTDAIRLVLDILVDPEHGVLGSVQELDAVGHRVVHGGERFAGSVRIDAEVMDALYDNVPLAPLHNPPNIQGIEAVTALLPDIAQVGVFDTAFHQTMEPHSYLYALPYRYYRDYGVRRYGFHGTSHQYVARRAAAYLGRPIDELKIVTCHLGNGASITAVRHGRSVMTSMGFTPLEGMPMGTRCGDVDPAIVPWIMEREGLDVEGINRVLNKESGVLGLSELSSDMRTFEEALRAGPDHPHYERSLLVLKLYTQRVKGFIGAYAAIMGGLDCVVFTGGVGENFVQVVEWSCQGLEFLGIDGVQARRAAGEIVEASTPGSRTRVLIVPTNEELAIARDTYDIVTA
ncbi:MAG: acetate kinase [Anaerolineaceae bacterium]|jgi:acetate kinase|nr:acetate kinase [Anaerolineae bacterium]NLF12355.1 acetate kinase [Anaerolineaceae bacterium]